MEVKLNISPQCQSAIQTCPKQFSLCVRIRGRHFYTICSRGITVGLVALPLAMAFGIASGVTPQAGLYTAVVAGFLISALGGSRTQIGGPTGAFVVIVAGIVARFGMSGLAMVTLMAGVILLVMGLTGLGSAVRFIPRPVVIGFTNGIAVLIASTQIKDFFGLHIGAVPSEFLLRMKMLSATFCEINGTCADAGRGNVGNYSRECRGSRNVCRAPSSPF